MAHAIRESNDVSLIEGPPGVGKSWLAKGIGAMWQAGRGSTVVAEGDLLRSEVAFYPFGLAMAALSNGWRSVVPAVAGAARASETLLGTAGLITSTVQTLAKARPSRRRAHTLFLGDAEQAVLYELERLSRKRPLLLVADNLHWWDAASLEFLGRMREPRMCEAFPFLREMRVLAAQTTEPYQSVAHPIAHRALLAPGTTRLFQLGRIQREGFEDVLAAMGATPRPSAATTDAVYSFSGGHLALASRCADRMAKGETDEFLSAADSDEFLRRLLTERLQSLGALGTQAMAVLQIAAVLGLTFRRDEVACASGADEIETARLLRYCRDENVVELNDGLGRFVHDLYRQHFLGLDVSDKVEIHDRLSSCLRVLRPAEYDLRCLNAIGAERTREAAALAIQAALQHERDGQSWRTLSTALLDAIGAVGWTPVVENFVAAMRHLAEYRFSPCQSILDRLPRDLPKCLLAEADYLRAMCLMSTRSEDDRARGRSLLEPWVGYAEEEPEVGIRIMQALLYGLTHLPDKEPGRRFEGRLRQTLVDRVSFDLAAKDALYTLDRCSGSLYQPDVALIRTREAADYFGPTGEQTLLRRPVEYYRCLVNLGANLICNDRCEEACDVYSDVEELVAAYPPGVFPRLDYPRTNGLLAAYRSGIVRAEEAVRRQQEAVASSTAESDPFYVENALAVYLALCDRHQEALDILDRLDGELTRTRSEPEPSMVYTIRSNRCVTRFLAGDCDFARSGWAALDDVVGRIAYVTRPIHVRRHQLLAEVIAGEPMEGRAFDECLLAPGATEFGPLWRHFGRGFRMPDVEFWRES